MDYSIGSYAFSYIKKRPFIIGLAMLSIFIGVSFLTVLLGIWMSIQNFSQGKVGTLSDKELEVTPAYKVGFLRVIKTEQKPLSQEAVDTIKGHTQVEKVIREEIATFPSSLFVDIFGASFQTDSPIYGLEDEEFYSKIQVPKKEGVIPVLLSQELLDVYNVGIAQVVKKPQFTNEALAHFPLKILVGTSSFITPTSKAFERTAEVVGVASGIAMVGITLPLSEVEQLAKTYGDSGQVAFSRIKVLVREGRDVASVKSMIQKLGFDVTTREDQVGPVKTQLQYVVMVFSFVAFVVLLLVILHTSFLFFLLFEESHFFVAMMRFFGAHKNQIIVFYLLQILFILLPPILIGMFMGQSILWMISLLLMSWYPTIVVSSFTTLVPWLLWCVVSVFFLLVFLTTTVFPIRRAFSQHLTHVFAQQ